MVACKKTSGLCYIPYNEVYIRVGGHGRIVNGVDVATGEEAEPSYETGLGLPIALFVRTATYGNLISLMRARARLVHVLGEDHMKGIPLLLITPEQGVKVFTETLQGQFWKIAAQSLNPFQNSNISHKTTSNNADEAFMKQKMSELIHLDETIQERLTPEELARIAGGFGATDESLEEILTNVMLSDKKRNDATDDNNTGQSESHQLQDVVNEGLVYAVRSGDYHCSRQLLILYSIVATRMADVEDDRDSIAGSSHDGNNIMERRLVRSPDLAKGALMDLSKRFAAPPPPPLDTDRLRSATNSDGLLAVLGAAQVLKCMKDGGAKRRVDEVISALEEWLEYGQSVAFRIASWQHQRAAQRDLKIATESHSNFMAFAGTKVCSFPVLYHSDVSLHVVSETRLADFDLLFWNRRLPIEKPLLNVCVTLQKSPIFRMPAFSWHFMKLSRRCIRHACDWSCFSMSWVWIIVILWHTWVEAWNSPPHVCPWPQPHARDPIN